MSSPTDYSTLAVFTYRSAIVARTVPRQHMHRIAHAVIGGLFGDHTDSMFSLTVTASGAFLLADSGLAALASELPRNANDEDTFRCLYLHESSETRRGSQIAGTLSALSARLAAEAIPVLSTTTLGRNFLLVREGATERALVTLQRTLDEPSSLPAMPPPPADRMVLTVLPAPVCICSLSRDELPAAAHALLWLFALQPAAGLTHVFEMGGEVSLIFESPALHALTQAHPASASALLHAAGPTLERGWRALSIVVPLGAAEPGLLSRVCLPLSTLPMMNVSTGDTNLVLVPGDRLDAACALLAPHFELRVAEEGAAR
mmetsp:Transcript_30731/g.96937  ORF Transcript_30731/g.96937 Transcript_30731/m.96937 type:complete len:317 (-) Transcript_30731:72-1022(-)